jgi:hypothetical protein
MKLRNSYYQVRELSRSWQPRIKAWHKQSIPLLELVTHIDSITDAEMELITDLEMAVADMLRAMDILGTRLERLPRIIADIDQHERGNNHD